MVIFTGWCIPPVFPRSTCGLPMTGEDTGLEAVASPMAGYLGKVQQRAASLDSCPWCTQKGMTFPLRSYRINLEESITLCTNPQCLFPLVSRPLEDVLSSLVPVQLVSENKRKSLPIDAQQPSPPSPKRMRLNELDNSMSPTISPSNVYSNVKHCNGQSMGAQRENVNVLSCQNSSSLVEKDNICIDLDTAACTDAQNDPKALSTGELDLLKSDNQKLPPFQDNGLNVDSCFISVDLDKNCSSSDGDEFSNKTEHPEQMDSGGTTMPNLQTENTSFAEVFEPKKDGVTETNTQELVVAPTEVFWRNESKLCWLNSLLVALVNLKTLRKSKPEVSPEQCPMWRLLTEYDDTCAAIRSQQRPGEDGCLKIPNHVLHTMNRDLETHRMSIFKILQPKLQCKLGKNDTPVFALPLLVKMDPWLESLFETTFYWEFKCTKCKRSSKQNVVKTLPTFTDIVPDWHPLRAVHFAPCNDCQWKNQRREMVLQRVPPVFALHFVEGLPDNNIQVYSFTNNKKHYSVSAIIQYCSHRKHFVTWVHRSDGSWVELDDLKHPHSKSYKTLPVPAWEIHIVFWEAEDEERQESRACSPSTTFTESDAKNDSTLSVTDLCSPHQSPLSPPCDPDVTDAMLEQDTTLPAVVDTSIGSTTLLDTFEGLTHSDIVTLTLAEMKGDGNNQNDNQVLKDVLQEGMEDTPVPDSSSTVEAKENLKEMDIDSSPVSELKSKRGQRKGRAAAGKLTKTAKVPDSSSTIEAKENLKEIDTDSSSVTEPEIKGVQKKGRSAAGKQAKTTKVPDSSSTIKSKENLKETDTDSSSVTEPEMKSVQKTGRAAAGKQAKTDKVPDSSSTIKVNGNIKETDTDSTLVSEPKSTRRQNAGRAAVGKQAKTAKFDYSTEKAACQASKNTFSDIIEKVSPTAGTKPFSHVSSPMSTTQNVPNEVPLEPPVVVEQQKGWSQLMSRSFGHIQNITRQLNATEKPLTKVPASPVRPTPQQKPKPIPTKTVPKPVLRTEAEGGLPLKAAEMYGAFGSKNAKTDTTLHINKMPSQIQKHQLHNSNALNVGFASDTSLKTKLPKVPPGLSETEALRYKLLRKLKAKKKKLAKLNGMLGQMGEGGFRPDSTDMGSPNTVTSSTLDEDFLSDLLSPATTITSTLSPDSTDFLEMLATGQDAGIAEDAVSNPVVQQQTSVAETEDFLDEFMSRAEAERPTEMEAEALSALELFL